MGYIDVGHMFLRARYSGPRDDNLTLIGAVNVGILTQRDRQIYVMFEPLCRVGCIIEMCLLLMDCPRLESEVCLSITQYFSIAPRRALQNIYLYKIIKKRNNCI